MAFDGSEGGEISEQQAVTLVTNFRQNNSTQPKGVYFDKTCFQQLLAQSNAAGIRVYFGEDNNNQMTVVMVAADQNEDDIVGKIMDGGAPCPSYCSTKGPLK